MSGHVPFSHRGRTVSNAAPAKGSITLMMKDMIYRVRSKWKYLLAIVLCMLFISLLEFLIPQLVQYTIDTVIPEKQFRSLSWTAAGILTAAALLSLFAFLNSYLVSFVGQHAIYDIRNSMYDHIQTLDMRFFDKNRTGDLMSRITNDVNILQQLVSSSMLQIFTDILTFFAVAAYMLYFNWKMTVILLLTFPLMIYITRVFGGKIRKSFRGVQETAGEVSNQLQDSLSGMRVIQTFTNEEYESSRFRLKNEENMEASLKSLRLRASLSPIIDFLNNLGLAAVIVIGAWQVMNGSFTVGAIVAFVSYLRLLQSPVRNFSRVISTVQQAAAAYERITEILETKPAIHDQKGARPLPALHREAAFRNIEFAYEAGVPVLSGIDFKMKAGETTALVGSSGAGKTTLTSLLVRFYDPDKGSIELDGHDIRTVTLRSLREQIGIVSQDIFLFNGTIRENIAYGRPGAAEEDIIAAARAANADGFIRQFPKGYESQVGERGVKLSGGQKQRIAIARALLKNPSIIILDEATASLDTESEHLIQQALQSLLTGRTCLVIAHRLSTIKNADKIIVMENGKLIESGNHEELLSLDGRYKQLYNLQFPRE